MPPKKANTTGGSTNANINAKTPMKPTINEAPASVTTRRGREIDTTAAAARPRRAPTTTVTAPANATTKKSQTSTTVPKKRGRLAKAVAGGDQDEADEAVELVKKRGRPAKAKAAEDQEEADEAAEPVKKRGRPAKVNAAAAQSAKSTPTAAQPQPTKKRGRPSKKVEGTEAATVEDGEADEDAMEDVEPPKKRGRPSKQSAPAKETAAAQPPAKKRGRPSTKVATEPEENPAAPDTPAPRKRGRGPTGGQTTKIASDAADAADQLEEELIDEATRSLEKSKGGNAPDNGKNYWAMKAEQVDRFETLKSGREFNTKFTIDDLKEANAPEPWEGVRNMVARNNMRQMKKGDLAFFYASQAKGKLQPGITGIIEIVREHEPDFTVANEDSIGYVEPGKRGKENQWSLVHVEYRKKLSEPVSLKQLQKFAGDKGILSNMQLLKQSRLSVAHVSEKEWDFIVNNMIEGYEDEAGTTTSNKTNGDQTVAGAEETETALPTHEGLPNTVRVNSIDDLLPTSSTLLAATTDATSRPASRGGSKTVSRQASLAPITQAAEAAAETIKTGLNTFVQALAPDSARPSSRASMKPASRSTSRAPSLKPASRSGSLEPSERPISRGKSPKPTLMASLMEE